MSATTGSPRKIAEEYVRAWLTADVEKALSFIADDVVCDAPVGQIKGREGYRQFLGPFATSIVHGDLVGVVGDDDHAATVYTVELPQVQDFSGMEYLTVEDGKITHVVSVFDRVPMLEAGAPGQD